MGKIENVSVTELEGALETVEGKRETMRLMVAILYKRGPSVPMIADWFNMRERTIYDWLDRLEERPIMEAVTDAERPGRPPRLSEQQRDRFEQAVTQPPSEIGYEQDVWTTSLAQEFLEDKFRIEYSRRHVQRLLTDAGLGPQRPQPSASTEDARSQYWTPDE